MRSARLGDEQGHCRVATHGYAVVRMQRHSVVWMQRHLVVPIQGEVKQTPAHQRMNVVQRPQEAEGQSRISPVQMLGDVEQNERGVGGLNQALELTNQPQERSYEAKAMRGDEIDGVDQRGDGVGPQAVQLAIEEIAHRR